MPRIFIALTFVFCSLVSGETSLNTSRLPLVFEPVTGKTNHRYSHVARARGVTYYFGARELTRVSPGGGVTMRFKAANRAASFHAIEPLPGKTNYLIGNNPKVWITDVPQYARVASDQIYPGIDVVFYGNQRELEYDVVVAPGADPSRIRLELDGPRSIEINSDGDIVSGDFRQKVPTVYQNIGGRRVAVKAHYRRIGSKDIGFELARYDRTAPLVIDPTLTVVGYAGGNQADEGNGIAVDAQGNAYLTGSTFSTNFPTLNPSQPMNAGGQDAFVTKLNPNGSIAYSTYLGGSGVDRGFGIAVDATGDVFVTGVTNSPNFPVMNAFQRTSGGGGDAFVTKFDANGHMLYSTYAGGSGLDAGGAIAVDPTGAAYITGTTFSNNFPLFAPSAQATYAGNGDAFLIKLNPNGNPMFSTFFGGAGPDSGSGLLILPNLIVMAGSTASARGDQDGFVATFDPGDNFQTMTRVGGSADDTVSFIAPFGSGFAIGGQTASTNFPVTQNAFQSQIQGPMSGFLTILNGNLTTAYSTYLGGDGTTGVTSAVGDPNTKGLSVAVSIAGGTSSKICPGPTDRSTYLPFNFFDINKPVLTDFACLNGDINSLALGPNSSVLGVGTIFNPALLPVVGNPPGKTYAGGPSDALFINIAPPSGGIIFQPGAAPLFVPNATALTASTLADDFDGNGGNNDVAIIEQTQGQGYVLFNIFNTASTATQTLFSPPFVPTGATSFQDTQTHLNDIAISGISDPNGTGSGQIMIGTNDGTGKFSFRPFVATPGATNLLSGDFNNDGRPDLAYIDFASNFAAVALNDGTSFFLQPQFRETGGFVPVSATVGDFNDDDNLDLSVLNQGISSTSTQSGISILLGDGKGNLAPTLPLIPVPGGGGLFMAGQADFNGDGFPDLVISGTAGGAPSLTLFLNNPASPGTFTAQAPIMIGGTQAPSPGLPMERMEATDAPTPQVKLPASTSRMPVVVGDFDADGNMDLAVANPATNAVTLLRGDGAGHFTAAGTYLVGQTPTGLAAGDFNKDGMPDLVVTTQDSRTGQFLLNRTTPPAVRAPVISTRGFTSAASFQGGAVSPGEFITLFGTDMGPTAIAGLQLDSSGKVSNQLAGTQVLFDGVPAPLIYTQAGQISAIVPYSVANKQHTQIQVVYQGRKSNVVARPVAQAKPAVFTQNSSGMGSGAILNEDLQLNTAENPATRGSSIVIYATGEGQTNPPGVDGQVASMVFPKPLQNVTVTIGGIPAPVQYAGAAPSLVAGVLQVNAVVPDGVTPGTSVPLVIIVGQASSQPGVTVAIK